MLVMINSSLITQLEEKMKFVTIPPTSTVGILVAMTLASLSHCRSRVATQRFAPNALPVLTSCLYRLCTPLSSTSTCSTHVT